jgi:hypothetical protein
MRLAVHVTPKAPRDLIAGWRSGELEVKVSAPPEDGRANTAACEAIARALGVPRSAVRVARGERARHKQVEIDGVTEDDLVRVFGRPPDEVR